MTAIDPASTPDAPSARRLLRSTAIAAAIAIAILVTVVLPAEYGVDPTGIGDVLGLKEMGEIKMSLSSESASQIAPAAAAGTTASGGSTVTVAAPLANSAAFDSTGRSDVTEVVLAPTQGKEIKLAMRKDARVTFSWATDRGVVNYDTHADSPTISYHGYGKGSAVKSNDGMLTAAFDGHHGWFWRNRTADTVRVTLRTQGDYQALKRM